MPHRQRATARETIIHNGAAYYRYPNSSSASHRNYFICGSGKVRPRPMLHRVIWEEHNGPIPAGGLIHHKDENPLNNDPANLQLKSRSEHSRLHCRLGGTSAEEHKRKIGEANKKRWAKAPVMRSGTCVTCGLPFSRRGFAKMIYCEPCSPHRRPNRKR